MNRDHLKLVVLDYLRDSIVEGRYLSQDILINTLVAEYESQGNFDRVIKVLEAYGDLLHKQFKEETKREIEKGE